MFCWAEKIIDFLKKTLFPKDFTCDICGVETFGSNLCDDCKKSVVFNDDDVCPVCGRKMPYTALCPECKDKPPAYTKAVSAFVYKDGAQILIWKFKNGSGYLKDYFADILAWKVLDGLPPCDFIVSVPMTRRDRLRRGYNQSDLLAKSLSKRINVAYLKGALTKIKENKEQKSLSQKEREENVRGCFRVEKRGEIKGKRILIADDVMTTGATANELAKILLSAGAEEVFVATAVSVEYKLIPEKK